MTLAHPFHSDEGVVCRAHSCANLGHWVSTNLQEEPPSLCTEREGGPEFPWLFIRPSRILFARKEGVVCRAPSSASLGRWVSARFVGRAPEPPHGVGGWSGVPLAFYATLAHPFHSEGGGCLLSPLEREPRSLGLGKVCRESPRASARSGRAVRSSPGFLCDPRASFSLGRRGFFAEPAQV